MKKINVLNSKFESKGSLDSPINLTKEDVSEPAVHQVVKAILAGKRQGTACTKNKALVSGGGKKPFKQKGTGRARQGSTRSPLMVGGGTMFGPTPRDFSQKVNKKMTLKAIRSVLFDKHEAGKLFVVDNFESNGKTKDLFQLLSAKGLLPSLLVTDDPKSLTLRAAKNLEHGKAIPVEGFNVYEAVKYENLLVEKQAFNKLVERLG
jgi:large subunit ribosomal protein L4